MKFIWVVCLGVVLMACQSKTQDKVDLKSQKDKVSYSIGVDIGRNLKRQNLDLNPVIVGAGIRDIFDSLKIQMSDSDMTQVMMAFQTEMREKQQRQTRELGERNKKAGADFLAANKTKQGVVTLPDGLQYKVIKTGTGPKPKASDSVTVHYRGTLVDGTEFDNTLKRGGPETFPLKDVVKGWSEAIQMMNIGSKWEIYIPSDLGFGEQGAGSVIPPNSVLIFEVELLGKK